MCRHRTVIRRIRDLVRSGISGMGKNYHDARVATRKWVSDQRPGNRVVSDAIGLRITRCMSSGPVASPIDIVFLEEFAEGTAIFA